MKRAFKKALKPDKPFREWAQENGIELHEIKQKRPKAFLLQWNSLAAAFLLFLVALFPVFLPGNKIPPFIDPGENNPPIEAPVIFNSQDAITQRITIEELYQIEGLLLFDINQIKTFRKVDIDLLKNDETFILSYNLDTCFIVTSDGVNGFYVDYKIRIYKYYEFYTYDNYLDLHKNFTVNNTGGLFEICENKEGLTEINAYVSFIYGGLEYFLQVKGFPGVTDITETTLEILLNDLFK